MKVLVSLGLLLGIVATGDAGPFDPCSADIVILLDQSGSIERPEFANVREVAKKYINSLDLTKFRVALVTYRKNANVIWDFEDPEATSASLASDAIDAINPKTKGDTFFTAALGGAADVFAATAKKFPCRVTVVFSDGADDDSARIKPALDDFSAITRSRICYVEMFDPTASTQQQRNRNRELFRILINADYYSRFRRNEEFINDLDDDAEEAVVEWVEECVCAPCIGQ